MMMGVCEKQAAEQCIKIIGRRLPLTPGETRLLQLIINDIRLEFELKGAMHPAKLEVGYGEPPSEWLW